jgi:hypothetical protein
VNVTSRLGSAKSSVASSGAGSSSVSGVTALLDVEASLQTILSRATAPLVALSSPPSSSPCSLSVDGIVSHTGEVSASAQCGRPGDASVQATAVDSFFDISVELFSAGPRQSTSRTGGASDEDSDGEGEGEGEGEGGEGDATGVTPEPPTDGTRPTGRALLRERARLPLSRWTHVAVTHSSNLRSSHGGVRVVVDAEEHAELTLSSAEAAGDIVVDASSATGDVDLAYLLVTSRKSGVRRAWGVGAGRVNDAMAFRCRRVVLFGAK